MTNYTESQINTLPNNHVYTRVNVSPALQAKIEDLRVAIQGAAVNPGLHLTRAFHGVVYTANHGMILSAWNRLQSYLASDDVAIGYVVGC